MLSNECEKMSDEWWVKKIEWPFFVGQTGSYFCNNGVDYLCPHWIPWWSHCLCLFQFSFRLCLVRVKAFPENFHFPEMLFSGKENVFMCLVVFQKNFRKKFSGVWKMLQGKDKPRKHGQNPDWRSTLDWVRRRGASRAPVRRPRRWSRSHEAPRRFVRSRSTLRENAIDAKARSSRGAIAQISAVYLI